MASKKARLTPPPTEPALVPAVGALILALSGAACGDDGTGDGTTGAGTTEHNHSEDTGPMPDASGDELTLPPMPDPTDTEGTSSGGSTTAAEGTGTGTDSGTTAGTGDTGTAGETAIPPMPPPTTGE